MPEKNCFKTAAHFLMNTLQPPPTTLLSLVVGWWGIPWGIFFTIQTPYIN